MDCGIYCINNKLNNKKYIGQSKHISERWRKHINELKNNYHHNDYLQKSFNLHGLDSFEFYVLKECSESELDLYENYYIDLYRSNDRNYGYNLKSGGQNGGSRLSDESKVKLSKSIKKSFEDSSRREIQRINSLKQWSNPEIKEKICGKNNGMYGRKHSKESKEKMSNSSKGRISWRRNRTPVFCIELEKSFKDATEAGKELKLDGSAILKVCKKQRKTCGGYHWIFNDMENNIC